MGAFDNLIPPAPTPDKPKGQFDNLIPDKALEAKRKPGAFDHLVPKKPDAKAPPASFADRPSKAKEYWDATKKAVVDVTGEVKAGWGDKSLPELWQTESLPAHLKQALDNSRDTDKAKAHREETAALKYGKAAAPTPEPEDKPAPGMIETLKGLGVSLKDKPGLVLGSLVKSVATDPELVIVPWLWDTIPEATAAKVAQAAKAMGATVDIAKVAEIGGRVAGRMASGAGVNVAVEGGDQLAKGHLDAGALGTAAAEGAITSIPGRFIKREPVGILRALDQESVHAPVADAPVSTVEPQQLDMLTPEEATKVAPVPESALTALGVSRENVARATTEDPITPEMIADVGKEKPQPPNATRDRVVSTIKNALIGGTIGAGVGYSFADESHKTTGIEMGALIGAALPAAKFARYTGPDISSLINARNGQVRVVARHTLNFQKSIQTLLPELEHREQLSDMIDRGVEPEVGTPMHDAYTNLKQFFAQMGQLAVDHGVVENLRDNYISHLVEEDPTKRKGIIQAIFGTGADKGSAGTGGVSGKTFGKERKYDTFEDLNAALKDSGLRIKTKDASEIAGVYANAVYKSVADKQLLTAVKEVRLADGSAIAMPVNGAKGTPRPPRDYVTAAAPQLQGVAIHPDVAPDLGFVYSHRNPNWVVKKLEQISSSVKRTAVAISMFHAKTLIENFMVMSADRRDLAAHPFETAKAALEMYRKGGNNDVIDAGLKHGLQIGTPDDNASKDIHNAMGAVADYANERLPLKGMGVAHVARALSKADHNLEHFTFGFLQTGFKIASFSVEYEKLIGRGLPKERAAKAAASLVNDIYGSLDYYRVATDTDSHVMRKLGTGSLGLNSRKVLQLAMFAPDWTIATFRSLAKSLPGGASDAAVSQIHRRYLVKNALYYLAFGNAINYALSNHSMFQNKDVTRLDMGDGRTMMFSKHTMEPMEWLRDPFNTAGNKLAFWPAAMWKAKGAYDRSKAYNKPTKAPHELVKDVAEGIVPISLQEFVQNGVNQEDVIASLFGTAGFPIYGKSDAEKAKEKDERKRQKQEDKANGVTVH